MSTRQSQTRNSRDPRPSFLLDTDDGESTSTTRAPLSFPRLPGPRAEVCRDGVPVVSYPDTRDEETTETVTAAATTAVAGEDGSRTSAPSSASGVTSTDTLRTSARTMPSPETAAACAAAAVVNVESYVCRLGREHFTLHCRCTTMSNTRCRRRAAKSSAPPALDQDVSCFA